MSPTRRQWGLLAVVLAVTFAATAGAQAGMPQSSREGTWEFYLPVRWTSAETFDFDAGSSLEVSPDVGWGFGFAYNLKEQLNVQFEFTWMDASFDATLATGDPSGVITGTQNIGGNLDSTTMAGALQYNFLAKKFTPFVIAGLGWTWYDSNIPTGPTQGTCWWTWYGYVCDTWQPTYDDSAWTYALGVGVRGDISDKFFVEASYNWIWADFDIADEFTSVRLDLGWMF